MKIFKNIRLAYIEDLHIPETLFVFHGTKGSQQLVTDQVTKILEDNLGEVFTFIYGTYSPVKGVLNKKREGRYHIEGAPTTVPTEPGQFGILTIDLAMKIIKYG